MKKRYYGPVLNVYDFATEDVLTTSAVQPVDNMVVTPGTALNAIPDGVGNDKITSFLFSDFS